MAQPNSYRDREYSSFVDSPTRAGKSAREVVVGNDVLNPVPTQELPGLAPGYKWENYFGKALSVATGSLTTIISKSITDTSFYLSTIEVGGENIATYSVLINGTQVGIKRTYYTYFEDSFFFGEYELSLNDLIEVKVVHNSPMMGDFESRIIGISKA